MQENLLHLFKEYPPIAVIISICISILIAIIGILPSVFITAANLLFFGFWEGTLISFLGESIGAALSFLLYRKGFKKMAANRLHEYPRVKQLVEADNKKAFSLVFSLRLIPFVPSGLITFAAAVGKVTFVVFLAASSLGKIPALFIEAVSVYEVSKFGWLGKIILVAVAFILLYWIVKKKKVN